MPTQLRTHSAKASCLNTNTSNQTPPIKIGISRYIDSTHAALSYLKDLHAQDECVAQARLIKKAIKKTNAADHEATERSKPHIYNLELGRLITGTKYAKVWLAKMGDANKPTDVIVKKTQKNGQAEAAVAMDVSHPSHTLQTYGFEAGHIVMEPAAATVAEIFQRIKCLEKDKKTAVTERIIQQMIGCLYYLFTKKLAHNDAHCNNFFYKKDGSIVVGDFGESRHVKKGYRISDANARSNPFFVITRLIEENKIDTHLITSEMKTLIDQMEDLCSAHLSKKEEARLIVTFHKLNRKAQALSTMSREDFRETISALMQIKS
jgi:hypothetical protein